MTRNERTVAPLLAVLASACTAAPPHSASPPLSPVVVPSPREEPPAPPADPQKPPLSEVREPDSVACRVSSSKWRSAVLRLSVGGQPFAAVNEAPATVVFGTGDDPKSAVAVLDNGQLLLRLVLHAKETRVFTRSPTPLAGILIPEADKWMLWLGGASGKLRVGVDASFVLESPERIEADLSCDALAISASEFDARGSVTHKKKLPLRSVARRGAEISRVAGGDAVARVRDSIEVGVLGRQGRSTRVLIEGDQYWVVGWMATGDLSTQPSRLGKIGHGTGAGRGARAGRHSMRVCDHDLEVVGELGEERARVGVLRAKSPFLTTPADVAAAAEGPVELNLPTVGFLWLKADARLLVNAEDLRDCGYQTVSY